MSRQVVIFLFCFAAGATSNFSDNGNWDAPPTANCISDPEISAGDPR